MDEYRVAFERALEDSTFRETACDDRDEDISTVLSRYKREGCAMLVTGDVSEDTADQAFQLLAGSTDEDRIRIIVLPDRSSRDLASLLPADLPSNDDSIGAVTTSPPPSLDSLVASITDAVVDRDAENGGLGPGQLRLLLEDLGPVVGSHDVDAVERFVRAVGTVVRGVRGMAYLRYPGDEPPGRLVDAVDGRIELREASSGPQQRWTLSQFDESTNWMSL